MRLPIDIKPILGALLFAFYVSSKLHAQVTQENPLHVMTMQRWTRMLNESVSSQNKNLTEMYGVQTAINLKVTKIKEWERKYNSYLKTARGFAESLKAGTTLYLEGVRTFQSLQQVQKAISANPQGIGTTVSMNNLYSETLAEFLNTYSLLRDEIAGEGKQHMLNGAERNEMLWQLSEQLQQLNQKLHGLALSIAYYNLMDVWKEATAGMTSVDHGTIAKDALNRWKRTHRAITIINKE